MPRFVNRKMFAEVTSRWHKLTYYQRFELIIALILTIVISAVVIVAMYHLVVNVFTLLVLGAAGPFDYRIFQEIFVMILTVLIAMEFNHTIVRAMEENKSIIQVKAVLLIALLVLVRKFIVLDTEELDPWIVASLAFAVLTIGIVYWLMRERDDRVKE